MSYIFELRKIKEIGHRPLQVVGCCIYLFNSDGEILLTQRRDDDTWCVPGGIVELGETPMEAITRETLEETGLKVSELKLFDVTGGQDGYHKFPNGDEIYAVDVHYTCHSYIGTLAPQEAEIRKLRFFDINNLPSDLWLSDKKIIEKIISQIK